MWETAEELRELQELLDRSIANAGSHLRSIFKPSQALSAEQLTAFFHGKRQIAVATVTARGEPRVAPVDALLAHARFCFGTHVSSARIRHLKRRPAISLTYFERDEIALIVHGHAELVDFGERGFAELDRAFAATYGGTPSTAEEGSVYARVAAAMMFTFARHPDRLQPALSD